jgi:hypothetical protein
MARTQVMHQAQPMMPQPMQQQYAQQQPMQQMPQQYAQPMPPMQQQYAQPQPMQMPQAQQQTGFHSQNEAQSNLQLTSRQPTFGHQPNAMQSFGQPASPMPQQVNNAPAGSIMRGEGGAASAAKRTSAPPPKPARNTNNPLEGTRFRPRMPRPEPQPTPVAKKAGKNFVWVFTGVAVAVGGLVTWLFLSFF